VWQTISVPQSLSVWQGPGSHRETTVVETVASELLGVSFALPDTAPAPEDAAGASVAGVVVTAYG